MRRMVLIATMLGLGAAGPVPRVDMAAAILPLPAAPSDAVKPFVRVPAALLASVRGRYGQY